MKSIKVSKTVWDDLVGKARDGESISDVLVRMLGNQEAINNKSLNQAIKEDPDILNRFVYIADDSLFFIHPGDMFAGLALDPDNSQGIDELKIKTIDLITDALFFEGKTSPRGQFFKILTILTRKLLVIISIKYWMIITLTSITEPINMDAN